MKKKLKFYEYQQNNVFGKYVCDDNLDETVYIQAHTFDEANKIGESLGMYFNGVDAEDKSDCPCCGNRWVKNTFELDTDFQNDLDEYVNCLYKDNVSHKIKIHFYKK